MNKTLRTRTRKTRKTRTRTRRGGFFSRFIPKYFQPKTPNAQSQTPPIVKPQPKSSFFPSFFPSKVNTQPQTKSSFFPSLFTTKKTLNEQEAEQKEAQQKEAEQKEAEQIVKKINDSKYYTFDNTYLPWKNIYRGQNYYNKDTQFDAWSDAYDKVFQTTRNLWYQKFYKKFSPANDFEFLKVFNNLLNDDNFMNYFNTKVIQMYKQDIKIRTVGPLPKYWQTNASILNQNREEDNNGR